MFIYLSIIRNPTLYVIVKTNLNVSLCLSIILTFTCRRALLLPPLLNLRFILLLNTFIVGYFIVNGRILVIYT